MFQLIIEGSDAKQRWRCDVHAGQHGVIGRDPDCDFPVPWDPFVSRRHARVQVSADGVDFEKLPGARNPLFFSGQEVLRGRIRAGEHFVAGQTSIHLSVPPTPVSAESVQPFETMTFDRKELRKIRFRDADKRIDVLANLPEVIWGARSDAELYQRLISLILTGVAHAEAAAVVELGENQEVRLRHWDRRRETAGEIRPSARLIEDALKKNRRTVLHVWASASGNSNYTEVAEFDWAFCTPVNDGKNLWGLYLAGRIDRPAAGGHTLDADGNALQADVKFTEIVAEIISSVQRLNRLERQQSGLRQFFAPPILSALGDNLDTGLLEPRESDVTILFCDLRGFSQKAEEAANDLLGLLDRVSRALEVMTHHILKHNGVTGDFQGDAALGFWGWPFASENAPLDACRAALGIRRAFAETRKQKDHPLADFEMGIGIAQGRAVAGKIGTSEQVKVTVFGPVVNLAMRLETMTKQLRVPILVDEPIAELFRKRMSKSEGRIRRLAKVLPYGMETPLVVSELVPPLHEYPDLSDEHLEQFEQGVDHFIGGRWGEAYRCFHKMPENDRAQDFLGILIAQHNRVAPPTWDGIVRLPGK